MSRDLKINILVDDHNAVQKLESVATAEDHVAASARQASVALDASSAQLKTTTVSTAEADRYLSDLHVNLAQMPSTLSAARTGLNGLAEGLGLTVESLGLMNAAGLVLGTAIGSWKLGRAAAEFFDLDDKIARSAATLLGWGNEAAETAAAKADVLAKASNAVGFEITDLTVAMQINGRTVDEWTQKWELHNLAVKRASEAKQKYADDLRELHEWGLKAEADLERQNAKLRQQQAETDRWREKVHELEHGGDHAFSTLHQWYGEMHRDQQHMNDLADQNIKKLEAAQQKAQQFLIDALNAAKAIDAELGLTGPIGHGPTTPNEGSSLNPSPIIVRPIGPISPPRGDTRGGMLTGQPTNTTLPVFADGGPTGMGGPAMLHPNEFVVPQGGALVKSGGSTIVINVDAKGAILEDDRSLDRLVDKISTRIGVVAGQRGAAR